MNAPTVMHVNEVEEQAQYMRAVAEIIGDIQREEKVNGRQINFIDIAETIDVSVATISNAFNKKSVLNAIYLKRLGKRFGAGYLNPYFRLMDAQAAPLDDSLTSDILPLMMAAAHKIAMARDPEGPGGPTEVPQEKRGYLNDLKKLQNRTACLVNEIEEQTA